jgi:transposase
MAHFTESCEEDQPHLIAHVETTAVPMADSDVLETIRDALAAGDLLPAMHLTDTGYVDAKRLLSSRTRYDIDLLGPTLGDYHRRGRENKGFAAQDFIIDWKRRQAICPAGRPVPIGSRRRNPEANR